MAKAKKQKKYFTTGDIARYCEVDVNTVKSWIKRGDLEAFTTPSGHYRILRARFINFIKDQGFLFDSKFFGEDANSPDILVIDDDPDHRNLIVDLLNQLYDNIKIDTALNGFDGYMKLDRTLPKLVLLDLVVPGVTGLEFFRIMRSNDKLKGVKVVVISANLDDSTIKELEKMRISAIINKPLKKEILKEKCDELLKEADSANNKRKNIVVK
ncbi:MAG: response regulator [Candidatus Marinimicrobia bacterium]|nr:response regulator [Candidatus Neomarinimicrobiota bacterium]